MLNFGGFLSSNFWTNYRCTSSASIEDLLNNKDCTVDKLLDDDDCLQEFKNYNDKLIKYFDHDKLKTLIDYITVMPHKDDGHNRGRKYPFITGEIFNCEINQILDKFFEAPVRVKEAKTEDKADEDKDDEDEEKEGAERRESDKAAGEGEDGEAEKEEKSKGEESAKKDDSKAKDENAEEQQEEDDDAKAKAAGAKNLEDADKEDADADQEAKKEAASGEGDAQDKADKQASAETAKTDSSATEAEAEQAQAKTEEAKGEDGEEKNSQEPESEEQVKQGKQTEGTKEPEEEENATGQKEESAEKASDKEGDKSAVSQTAETVASTLVTEEGEPEEEEDSKYVLLDRLFKFIRLPGNEQLNPVLSGYFCKLVSLLISRKQKSLVPYIFSPGSDIIECMVRHVYQKSISEVLNKLLTQIDGDYDPEMMAQIKLQQQNAVSRLIDMLGSELSEEHNLNASTIIQDMFETKEFYNIICKRENITKIVNFATAEFDKSTKSSKSCSLVVLNLIITNHIDRLKKKDQKGDDKPDNTNDDEDDMVQHNSEDDEKEDTEASNPNSASVQTNILVDILKDKIPVIQEILRADHTGNKTRLSVCDTDFVPLGPQRLNTVELVSKMIQLKKEPIFTALMASQIFSNIMTLVKQYPWNNFLQLKVINLFEQVFTHVDHQAFKTFVLNQTELAKSLAELGEAHQYEMESERKIRSGHMALVVTVSNLLVKKGDAEVAEDKDGAENKTEGTTATGKTIVHDHLNQEQYSSQWKGWVDGELKKSNENYKRALGGSVGSRLSEEDEKDDNNYDVQMEKIMARFTNFNQILSSGGSQDDDDDDDDDENTQDSEDKDGQGFDEDDDDKPTESSSNISSFGQSDAGIKLQKVNLVEPEQLDEEFTDNNYWKIDEKSQEVDVDALLAELEA